MTGVFFGCLAFGDVSEILSSVCTEERSLLDQDLRLRDGTSKDKLFLRRREGELGWDHPHCCAYLPSYQEDPTFKEGLASILTDGDRRHLGRGWTGISENTLKEGTAIF